MVSLPLGGSRVVKIRVVIIKGVRQDDLKFQIINDLIETMSRDGYSRRSTGEMVDLLSASRFTVKKSGWYKCESTRTIHSGMGIRSSGSLNIDAGSSLGRGDGYLGHFL